MLPTLSAIVLILVIGTTAAFSPIVVPIAAILTGALLLLARALSGLALWQKLMVIALAGFMVLNYGFANFTVPGTPIPVGHLLMLSALVLALPGHGRAIQEFLREPVAWWWGALLSIALLHVAVEFPRYGSYALRDASMVVEGLFLLLGYIWAREAGARRYFLQALAVVLALTTVYSVGYPYRAFLQAVSPSSGIFLPVPIVGSYNISDFIAVGLLLFWLLGKRVLGWPSALIWPLMFIGSFGLLMMQVRSTYVGLASALLLALGLRLPYPLRRRALYLLVALPVVGISMLFAVSLSGTKLQGRTGPVQFNYFTEYALSFTEDDVPGAKTREWRLTQWTNVIETTARDLTTLIAGQGFGEPLTNLGLATGTIARQPHNIHVSVFGRLGLLGLLAWFLFHASFCLRAYLFLKQAERAPHTSESTMIVAWLLLSHLILIVSASFGAALEFSDGAIPFYVLMGFTLRLARSPIETSAARSPWQTYPALHSSAPA